MAEVNRLLQQVEQRLHSNLITIRLEATVGASVAVTFDRF